MTSFAPSRIKERNKMIKRRSYLSITCDICGHGYDELSPLTINEYYSTVLKPQGWKRINYHNLLCPDCVKSNKKFNK